MADQEQNIISDDENDHWWLEKFYFNPADRRLFPPKRHGWGRTVNFGNIWSILVYIIIIILGILIGIKHPVK